jgi:hypothetical protein
VGVLLHRLLPPCTAAALHRCTAARRGRRAQQPGNEDNNGVNSRDDLKQ